MVGAGTLRGSASTGGASAMPNIGPLEVIIILAVLLLVFGPKRLPGLGKQLGTGMREFKESITGKDRDDDDPREQLPASTDAPAARREPEAVTAEARPEDQPEARRADLTAQPTRRCGGRPPVTPPRGEPPPH